MKGGKIMTLPKYYAALSAIRSAAAQVEIGWPDSLRQQISSIVLTYLEEAYVC